MSAADTLDGNSEKKFPLEKSLGFLLSKAAQRITDLHAPIFERAKLAPKQFGILTLLTQVERLSQVEIGRILQIDRSTMVLLIDELEHNNHVIRKRDPNDRRAYGVELTKKGRKAQLTVAGEVARSEQRYLDCFTEFGFEDLQTALKCIISRPE